MCRTSMTRRQASSSSSQPLSSSCRHSRRYLGALSLAIDANDCQFPKSPKNISKLYRTLNDMRNTETDRKKNFKDKKVGEHTKDVSRLSSSQHRPASRSGSSLSGPREKHSYPNPVTTSTRVFVNAPDWFAWRCDWIGCGACLIYGTTLNCGCA